MHGSFQFYKNKALLKVKNEIKTACLEIPVR